MSQRVILPPLPVLRGLVQDAPWPRRALLGVFLSRPSLLGIPTVPDQS